MTPAAARVLTAESDPAASDDLRLVLENAGFSICAHARDGLEAVDLAREHKPDLVLLDLGLPCLDGVEATRQILAERDVPIVALTGRSRELADEVVGAGATACVAKPVAPVELVDVIVGALARRPEPTTQELRAESRRALARLLGVLGYPEAWADELERRCYADGRIWRIG
jgi:response regulator NasT